MPSSQKRIKRRKGISLVEVSLFLIGFGVLLTLCLPLVGQYRIKSLQVEGKMLLSSLKTMEDAWYKNYGSYSNCFQEMGISSLNNPSFKSQTRYSFGFTHWAGGKEGPNAKAVQAGAPKLCNKKVATSRDFFILGNHPVMAPGFKKVKSSFSAKLSQHSYVAIAVSDYSMLFKPDLDKIPGFMEKASAFPSSFANNIATKNTISQIRYTTPEITVPALALRVDKNGETRLVEVSPSIQFQKKGAREKPPL